MGFVLYLEYKHRHSYRKQAPGLTIIIFWILGIILFRRIEGVIFILLAIIYTKKNYSYFGVIAPIMRGLQTIVIIGGVMGYNNSLVWIGGVLILFRNLLGDLRDVKKDRIDGLRTLPIVLGIKNSISWLHFAFLFITSSVWWYYTRLPIFVLPMVLAIEAATYKLTKR